MASILYVRNACKKNNSKKSSSHLLGPFLQEMVYISDSFKSILDFKHVHL